ncbi:hypothetical protein PAXINDRAFT_12987 [Paxillus involutus ATCC 200175]|uniref:Endonuclease/exonuclease/phosphatase domain-containing protein n=1 Tax=Paxillus involutus ATCC 200175 TaxID=664439 RepID=A0A0C9TVM0_PAXIN|nr:hypothetical protein PAXINDRAFT_12987 [Paxillus involutus ATCC 200175]
MLDIPRPLRAVRYSMHNRRWAQTSNCAKGVKEPLPSSIRVLTWNIDFASRNPRKRLVGALGHIQEVFGCMTPGERPEPCCILLQEVSIAAFPLILTNEWVQRCFVVVPSSTDKWAHGATYGTVTLVARTVPVCGAFTIDFSNSRMHRNALFVDVKLAVPAPRHAPRLSDGIIKLRIANTHLESLPVGAWARPEQLKIIAESLQEYDIYGGIVGGDMNAIGPTDLTLAEEVGLADAWQGVDDDERSYTWGYQPPCEFPPGRLDKILWVPQGGVDVEEPASLSLSQAPFIVSYSSDYLTMRTTFASIALFVAGALAQFTINTPANVVECQPTLISWSGGVSPFFLVCETICVLLSAPDVYAAPLCIILPGGSPTAAALENLGQQNGTSVTWTCNIQAGVSLGLTLRDSTGATAQSAPFTVNPGSSITCLNTTSIVPGPTAATTPAAASSATVPAGSTTAKATTTASTSTSASASPSKGAASSTVARVGAAGVVGAAVAALLL